MTPSVLYIGFVVVLCTIVGVLTYRVGYTVGWVDGLDAADAENQPAREMLP